jgi:hypothetical protein
VADEPCAELLVDEAYGVNGITNRATPEGLQTFVTTTSGSAYQLLDFKLQRKWQPLENDFVTSPVVTPDGRLFGLAAKKDFELVEMASGQETRSRMSIEDIHQAFRSLPGLAKLWEGRIKEEREGLKEIGLEHLTAHPKLVPSGLAWVYFGFLALNLQIHFLAHAESALLLLDSLTLAPAGYAYVEDRRILDFAVVKRADGLPRFFVTLLSDFELSYDLVKWFHGAKTKQGWIFVPEGSTLRTRDDLVQLCMTDASEGFAADDSGGLFQFSEKTQDYWEVDRDKDSSISGLTVLE